MIKRNGDNAFAIAARQNDQSPLGRSAVSLCPGPGAASTRIPQPRAARTMAPPAPVAPAAGLALGVYVEKWKSKYEDSERKFKASVLRAEKAKREQDELQRRYNIIVEERNHLAAELAERERELSKLKTASEKVFTEYQQLRNQHEVDAGVMQKVMQQAGEWYKQNKQLKRRSTALLQALPHTAVEIDLTDSTDTDQNVNLKLRDVIGFRT